MSTVKGLLDISEHSRFFILSLLAMIALAGLDILGALAAKEWSKHGHPAAFLAGLVAFGVLFAVYAKSLDIAELPVVTLGWIVFLQIGLVVIDRVVYGHQMPIDKWVAVILIVILQGYIMLAPNERA